MIHEPKSPNVTFNSSFSSSDITKLFDVIAHPKTTIDVSYLDNDIQIVDIDCAIPLKDGVLEVINKKKEKYKEAGHFYPVSITGLKEVGSAVGSHRFCMKSSTFSQFVYRVLEEANLLEPDMIGVSEYLRFMEYSKGGEHYPHYDSDFSFVEAVSNRTAATKKSLVMYFTDNDSGEIAFVHDVNNPNKEDWGRQANESEIYLKIEPKKCRIVIFPHDLCHTVLPLKEDVKRLMVRGDIIYYL